jgi:ribonucleoside-diphosphate reductase alpha chain
MISKDSRKVVGEYVFLSKYSQTHNGVKETWDEAVNRVMTMHWNRYKEIVNEADMPEFERLFGFAEKLYHQQHILGAQRALQYGGELMLEKHARFYNCLGGETQIVTDKGVFRLDSFKDGDVVCVPTHTGKWQKATVRNYGKDWLNKITFNRGSNISEVYATADHRWINKYGNFVTSLSEGDKLYKTPNIFDFVYEEAEFLEKLYWCYGFVYGDGVVSNGHSHVRLCDKKRRFKERFEECGFKTSSNLSIDGDFFAYTGTYLKTLPNIEKDGIDLVRAFVSGYLCADGHLDRNKYPDTPQEVMYHGIQTSSKEAADFIENIFPSVGAFILKQEDLSGTETNFGKREFCKYFRLSLRQGKTSKMFKVQSVEEKARYDEVWCLEVENDHSFILANGMVTGNCSSTYIDRVEVFEEIMYLLLCGAGTGYSVQHIHTEQLPIPKGFNPKLEKKIFVIPDTIEGWAKAAGELIGAYYYGRAEVLFDYSQIRPKGAYIRGGFRAPGPEPLREALDKVRSLLCKVQKRKLRPFELHYIICVLANSVVTGGVRRSAMISIFDADDVEMAGCKVGAWISTHPELCRSNNSAAILPNTPKETFDMIYEFTRKFGEPGFVFIDSPWFVYNPCGEVGMYPRIQDENGAWKSGWGFCNLSEINGGKIQTEQDFYDACVGASVICTLQAGYTNFKVLQPWSQKIAERDALIGVGITGLCENPDSLFNPEVQRKGAMLVKETNQKIARMIRINPAARCTVVKPSGNSSQLLGTLSGITPGHARHYIRHIQAADTEQAVQLWEKVNPNCVEPSAWNPNREKVLAFPVTLPEGAILKQNLSAIEFLKFVLITKQNWIEYGTNFDHPSTKENPTLRMNVSNTCTVKPDEWDEVREFLWEHRGEFGGISLLSSFGDLDYPQAPYTEVLDEVELAERYGAGAILSSGLIVDAADVFKDVWEGCNAATGLAPNLLTLTDADIAKYITDNIKDGKFLVDIDGVCFSDVNCVIDYLKRRVVKRLEWVRRFNSFADKYMEGDRLKTAYCLKHVNAFHKWQLICRMKPVDYSGIVWEEPLKQAGSQIGTACAGGSCEWQPPKKVQE